MGFLKRIFKHSGAEKAKKRRKHRGLATAFAIAVVAFPGACVEAQVPQAPLTQNASGLSDNQLLDITQRQTLNYFTGFAHPVSGMARERTNNIETYGVDVVATGGTGFGIMAIIAGTSHGWLPRDEAFDRIEKIVDFLSTTADRYNGLFPHFLDGTTGKTYAMMNPADDGSDVVESAFLFQGLLTAREYFNGADPKETALRAKINTLWEAADWTAHVKPGGRELIWNHSPNHAFKIDLPVRGWNEGLIAYVIAASSPTHPISREVFEHGWNHDGRIVRNKTEEGYKLQLGGGPLFFTQYSFLGLDPRELKDGDIDYGAQARNQALADHAYAVRNPRRRKGYGPAWGLTASDGPEGYQVGSPQEDEGVIAPTAALSSFPYTPEHSMLALRHYYEDYNGKLWGKYGFVDAFNEGRDWQASTSLALDEGPIVVMIENHRTGLLWNLFMGAPEIQRGLRNLGLDSPHLHDSSPLPPRTPPAPPKPN